jgi:hypothetical protein
MKKIITLLILACSAHLHGAPESSKPAKPNILFIITDDQGYGDWSTNGHPLLKTPHVDKLAAESVRLENFYVSASCSPTRAALLTGMHEFRSGVTHTQVPREELWKGATTLQDLLAKAGYRNGWIGKWHLSNKKGFNPHERGFEWCSSNLGGPFELSLSDSGASSAAALPMLRHSRKGFASWPPLGLGSHWVDAAWILASPCAAPPLGRVLRR